MRGLPLRRTIGTYAGAVGATILITVLGGALPPPLVLAGITLLFVALLVLDIYSWQTGQHGGMPAWKRGGAQRD